MKRCSIRRIILNNVTLFASLSIKICLVNFEYEQKKKKKMRKHRVNPVTRQWQARDRGAIRLKKRRVQRQYL